jgi:uncharacterized protein
VLGDRLKIRIAAPPAGGQANRAVMEFVGRWLDARVEIVEGFASPRKTLRLRDVASDAEAKLRGES